MHNFFDLNQLSRTEFERLARVLFLRWVAGWLQLRAGNLLGSFDSLELMRSLDYHLVGDIRRCFTPRVSCGLSVNYSQDNPHGGLVISIDNLARLQEWVSQLYFEELVHLAEPTETTLQEHNCLSWSLPRAFRDMVPKVGRELR
jgi:hypothetical protein